jgi:quinoprotein glucose dehydrogenase
MKPLTEWPKHCIGREAYRIRLWLQVDFGEVGTVLAVVAAVFMGFTAAFKCGGADVGWPTVGGDKGGSRYSTLSQINRTNVSLLEVAWTYHAHDSRTGTTIECTPVVVGDKVFVTTASCRVVALDADTGCERWRFDPYQDFKTTQPKASGGVNRGVAFWTDGKQQRIFLGAPDGRLISLDGKTGRPDPAFGRGGTVDLREGVKVDLDGVNYGPTSAPGIYKDIVILGFSCPEGGRPAPGDPRAFDVRTGKELWRFHTIPVRHEYGHDSWQENPGSHVGAANNWSGSTVDEERGLLFIATGSAAPDFYGGGRKGNNLFANCVICLNARTGKRRWHFQTLRHDLWDHDLPTVPNLVTVLHGGRQLDAVAQVTKTGYVYLFDRRNGRPLFPIEEKPVLASDVPGEQASPTQPFPAKPPPFSRQFVGEQDVTDISPEAHEEALRRFRNYRSGAAFTPPSTQGTIIVPGFHGGATWSGASFDPTTGLLYVNSNEQPNVLTLTRQKETNPEAYKPTGYVRFLDQTGYPAIKPPWGLLNAIDLNRGEIVWQVPLGEYPELTARGIPQTGTENFGGTIVTAGGLVFIGGTKDEMFHAFDKTTGKLLWQHKLEAGGYATPCTYRSKNRQFVVIAAGGGGKLGTKSGDAYVAFAFPDDRARLQ